jgi:hypothetical protein
MDIQHHIVKLNMDRVVNHAIQHNVSLVFRDNPWYIGKMILMSQFVVVTLAIFAIIGRLHNVVCVKMDVKFVLILTERIACLVFLITLLTMSQIKMVYITVPYVMVTANILMDTNVMIAANSVQLV